MLELLSGLLPATLLTRSGAVFNTGRSSFESPSKLYLLGLNPGGDPATHEHETVGSQMASVLAKPGHWSAFRDDSWDGYPPGANGMQPHVVHLLQQLGHEAHAVPTSNLIFERTRSEEDLKSRRRELAEACWPVHEEIIDCLGVKVILCFGSFTGRWVRKRVGAHRLVDSFVEKNKRRWKSTAHANSDGLIVVTASHPARAHWRFEATDPSPLVKAMLERAA